MDYATYTRPQLPPGTIVADLSASTSHGPVKEPKPEERVLCINRGRVALEATFDSQHKVIPSGFFEIEYEAAKHFRGRLIVPGTRNIELGGHVSYIGILHVDSPDKCRPFSDEELQHFGEKVEAIDRSALSSASDRDVEIVRVANVQAQSLSYGVGGKSKKGFGVDASVQATPAAEEAAAHVLDRVPLEQTEAHAAQREAERDGRSTKRR